MPGPIFLRRLLARVHTGLAMALCLAGASVCAQDTYLIEPRPGTTIPAQFFGMHFHGIPPEVDARGVVVRSTEWPAVQVGAIRLWNAHVRWADIEPGPSQWRFERFDRIMALAEQHGAQVVYTLGSTPRWASARPQEPCGYWLGCSAEPVDTGRWDLYVQTVARRYKGRIAYYEAWNEPNPQDRPRGQSGYFSGDWPTLLELTRRARAVLQREDPSARLLSPAFDGPTSRVERFLSLGGGALVDGLAFHYYGPSDQHVAPLTTELRNLMSRYGLAHKPLLNTEIGYGAPELSPGKTPPNGELSAALTVRAMTLGAFLGLDGWFHHAWDNGHTGMVDAAGRHLPAYAMYQRVQGWLLGLEPLGCKRNARGVVMCRGRQNTRELLILWRQEGQAAQLEAGPADFTPQYIENALTGAIEMTQWQANAGKWPIGATPVAFWSAKP